MEEAERVKDEEDNGVSEEDNDVSEAGDAKWKTLLKQKSSKLNAWADDNESVEYGVEDVDEQNEMDRWATGYGAKEKSF